MLHQRGLLEVESRRSTSMLTDERRHRAAGEAVTCVGAGQAEWRSGVRACDARERRRDSPDKPEATVGRLA